MSFVRNFPPVLEILLKIQSDPSPLGYRVFPSNGFWKYAIWIYVERPSFALNWPKLARCKDRRNVYTMYAVHIIMSEQQRRELCNIECMFNVRVNVVSTPCYMVIAAANFLCSLAVLHLCLYVSIRYVCIWKVGRNVFINRHDIFNIGRLNRRYGVLYTYLYNTYNYKYMMETLWRIGHMEMVVDIVDNRRFIQKYTHTYIKLWRNIWW